MKNKLKSLYKNKKQFKKRTISSYLLGDGIFCFFLVELFKVENLVKYLEENQWMYNLGQVNIHESQLPILAQLMSQSLIFFILLLIVSNLISYFFFYREKKWAIGYIKGQGFTGFIFAFLSAWEGLSLHLFWTILLLLAAPLYLYGYLGCRYHFNSAKNLGTKKED